MSYRDDLEAAKERRNALANELRSLERKMDELDALKTRKQELQRELQKSAGDLDRARARVSLPLLSRVKVASPCNASWDAMTGDDHVRHCGQCDKNVFDLSSLNAQQAEALLAEHGSSLCVRFYRRRDGTVLTSDCPVGRKRRRKQKVAAVALAGVMSAGIGYATAMATLGKQAPTGEATPTTIENIENIEPLMGKIDPGFFEEPEVPEPIEEEPEYEELMGDVDFVEDEGS